MKKLKYLLPLVIFGVFSCSGKQPQVEGRSKALALPRSVVVVYENDVHCNWTAMQNLRVFAMQLLIQLMF